MAADFNKLICPLPKGVMLEPDKEAAQEIMEEGAPGRLEPMGTVDGTDVFGIWLPANTTPWMTLLYPNGSPITGRGVRIGSNDIQWSPNGGATNFTSWCPEGAGHAGSGWKYRFCPRYSLVVGIGGVQVSRGDQCGNPRDVFSVGRPGQIAIAFNDSAAYNNNTGGCTVIIYAVYQ